MRRKIVATVAAAIAVTLFAGCAPAKQGLDQWDFTDRRVEDNVAQLDPTTDSAALPLDAFRMTDAEAQTVAYAQDLWVQKCMADVGLAAPAIDRRDGSSAQGFRIFGVWVKDVAAVDGYNSPRPSWVEEKVAVSQSQVFDSQAQKQLHACRNEAESTFPLVTDSRSLATRAANLTYEATIQLDPMGVQLVEEWRSCMADEGIRLLDDLHPDLTGLSEPKRIEIALADVRCKDEFDTVQRLADIAASYQVVIVKQSQKELETERARMVDTVNRANDYINSIDN